MIEFTIPGEPTSKARPRFSKGHTYTAEKTVLYENLVKLHFVYGKNPRLEGEIKAEIQAYYAIPKSGSKALKKAKEENRIRPTKKPDADNVAKVVLDALNGLAYGDDSQIVELVVKKFYGEPRVEVRLSEVKE